MNTALWGIFMNKGEVCAAGSRLLVQKGIYDEFLGKLTERVKRMKIGDPFEQGIEMGPIVSERQLTTVLGYIEAGKAEGAKVLTGGARGTVAGHEGGYFVQPTIFDGVKPGMKIAQEEIFRTGARGHALRDRSGGDPTRQQYDLRPRQRRVDQGPRTSPPNGEGDQGRHSLGERLQRLRRSISLRRLWTERLGARDGRAGAGALHSDEERLGAARSIIRRDSHEVINDRTREDNGPELDPGRVRTARYQAHQGRRVRRRRHPSRKVRVARQVLGNR